MKKILFFISVLIISASSIAQIKIFAVRLATTDTTAPPPPTPVDTTPVNVPPRQNLLANVTFESTDSFNTAFYNTQHCCSYSANIVSTDTAYKGSHAIRFSLYKTDPNVSSSKRSEIVEKASEPLNAERWIGVAAYFPSTTWVSDQDPESILQFHHNSSTGSPPFSLWTWNDKFYCTRVRQVGSGYQNSYYPLVSVPHDQWVKIVLHYKERSDANGLIQIYINDSLVYNEAGVVSFTNVTNYFKAGIYKFPWKDGSSWGGTQTYRQYYLDDLRIGNENATYYDVVPGNY